MLIVKNEKKKFYESSTSSMIRHLCLHIIDIKAEINIISLQNNIPNQSKLVDITKNLCSI
jgi:hypothetical protein